MKYEVRPYTKADYNEIKRWWEISNEGIPVPELFPEESTLVVEANGVPALALIIFLTNCKELCYFEGFIGNPDVRGETRRIASDKLADAAFKFAKDHGYKRAITFSYVDKVKHRILELGFTKTIDNLTSFVKEL